MRRPFSGRKSRCPPSFSAVVHRKCQSESAGEGAASLLIQKGVAEITQHPDFSPAGLPCALQYLREWLHNEE